MIPIIPNMIMDGLPAGGNNSADDVVTGVWTKVCVGIGVGVGVELTIVVITGVGDTDICVSNTGVGVGVGDPAAFGICVPEA